MTARAKIVTATLLGVTIAAVKGPFQWPITDYLIFVEAPILGISFLLLGKGGATYSGLVNGLLQSAIKVSFFPLDLLFGVLYGVTVDIFGTLLGARGPDRTSLKRMTAALGLASTVTGVSIAYAVIALNISLVPGPLNISGADLVKLVYIPIVVWGILSGTIGGLISARIWDKNLRPRFGGAPPGTD